MEGVQTKRNVNHVFMMEVNLSNMLFGGLVIEAIDFPPWLPSSALRDGVGSNTHKFVNVEFDLLSWWHSSRIW